MRILVADDDPVYQCMLSGLLEEWGHECILAHDGREAWEILQRPDSPQIALLDWFMPGCDGFGLCQRVRERSGQQYVILVTGSRQRDEILRVVVAGADDYLVKPFEPLDLKMRLLAAGRIINLQEENRALQQKLEAAALV
jgi:DNA-binding response OmpR family regulator